jgi:hypothetical protein
MPLRTEPPQGEITTGALRGFLRLLFRLVSLYAYVDKRTAAGDEVLIRSASTGEIERIKLL